MVSIDPLGVWGVKSKHERESPERQPAGPNSPLLSSSFKSQALPLDVSVQSKSTATNTCFRTGKLHDLGGQLAAVYVLMIRLSLGQFKYKVLATDCTVSAPDIQLAINDRE